MPDGAGKESTTHENEQLRLFSMVVGCGCVDNRSSSELTYPPSCVSCKGGGCTMLPFALAVVVLTTD